MNWAELHDVLRDRGLIRAEHATGATAAGGVVGGIAYDSERVKRGDVFVALKGFRADGTAFAPRAIARGAVAVVSEQPALPDCQVPWAVVSDGRLALAELAASFHRHPSREMRVIGVTGTNGKTMTAHLIASIFEAANVQCGLLGTVGYRIGGDTREAPHTTPESPEVQELLREMVDHGCGTCVMEVSSHALSLRRVDAVRFAAGIFTNLTRDHLDFHADLDTYFHAKRRLFEMLPPGGHSVINLDDPRGQTLIGAGGHPVTIAIDRPADVSPGPLSFSLDGLAFDVRVPGATIRVQSALIGRPNVYNILAAVATATAFDVCGDAIERGIKALASVPGRFEVVSGGRSGVTVIVDYAHTDDALRNLLETAQALASGRLITVFGCGGDRDRSKRPLMGAVAGRLSDVVVITSDNPRTENPHRIIAEIQRGIRPDSRRAGQRVLTIPDRHAAISEAIELARPGDLVLVAGKGHEKYQVVGEQLLPFDDVAVAREVLARRRTNSGVA